MARPRAPIDRLTRHEVRFLVRLAEAGVVAEAARRCGLSRNAGYQLLYRVRERFGIEADVDVVVAHLRETLREAS